MSITDVKGGQLNESELWQNDHFSVFYIWTLSYLPEKKKQTINQLTNWNVQNVKKKNDYLVCIKSKSYKTKCHTS